MKVKRFLLFLVLFTLHSLRGQAQVSQMSAGMALPTSCVKTVIAGATIRASFLFLCIWFCGKGALVALPEAAPKS